MSASRTNARRLGILRLATIGVPLTPLSLALLGAAVAVPSAGAAINDNLLGHYKLDETDAGTTTVLNSAPGATENGLRSSTMLLNQSAVVGTGFGFDGVNNNDVVHLGTTIADDLANTDKITISAWVNPSFYRAGTTAASRHTIVATNADLSFSLASGNLVFNYKDVGSQADNTRTSVGANNLAGGMIAPLNQLSHVAVTRDGTSIAMYINGILVAQQTGNAGNFYLRTFDHDANPATPADVGLYIGTINGSTVRDYDGIMDDVGIWSGRALSQQQIATIAGLGGLTHAVDLASSQVDDVVGVFSNQTGTTAAGGYQWSYTDYVPAPADASTLFVGKHYTGTDGHLYIVLGGSTNLFSGVTTAPIPSVSFATWDGGGNGNWSGAANWVGDVTPSFASPDISVLTFAGPAQTANNDISNALVAGIVFDAAAGTFTITGNGFTVAPGATKFIRNQSANTQTISTGAITLAGAGIDAAAAPLIINSEINVGATGVTTLRGASPLTINGKITGAAAIHKRDAGTLTLTSASSDFTGPLSVFDGALVATSSAALGSSAGTLATAGGSSTGRVELNGSMSVAKPIELAGRTGLVTAAAPSIVNQGAATLSGGVSITSGGTLAAISSEAGNLVITGSVVNNLGTSGAINLVLGGAGQGEISGAVAKGTGTGAYGVSKVGTGTWTLSGGAGNNYTGATTVVAGTLKIASAPVFSDNANKTTLTVETAGTLDLTAISNYELQIGQTLRGKGIVKTGTLIAYDDNAIKPGDDTTGNVGTLSVQGNLSLQNQFAAPAPGSNLTVELGNATTVGAGVNDLIDVTGDLALNSSAGAILVNVNPVGGHLAAGSYQLIKYSGSKSGSASWNVQLPLASGYRAMPTVDDSPSGHVDLVVPAGMSLDLTWKGDGSANNWNVNADSNWNNNSEKFFHTDRVTFDDSSTNTTVNITEPVYPGAITVNASQDYTIIGNGSLNTLSGSGVLTKMGSGNLLLTNVNTGTWNVNFTGSVQVLGGTLSLTHWGNLAQSSLPERLVLDGGAIRFAATGGGNTGRLFSLGTHADGGTVDNSSGGSVNLNGTGAMGFVGSGARKLTLTGTYTGTNTLAALVGDGPGGATRIVKSGVTGWTLINVANSFTGGVTVNDGTLTVARVPGGAVAVSGGLLKISGKASANSADGTSMVTSLAISGGAMDLTNNSLVVDYTGAVGSLVDDMRQHLLNARLTTSSVLPSGTKLGYGDNAVLGKGTFGGVAVDGDSVLVQVTYAGDANLDGQVDITDLAALATNWQVAGPWTAGDFDYSGIIDITDLAALATNWQVGVGAGPGLDFSQALASVGLGGVAVPEPASLGLIGASLLGIVARRRRTP